MNKEIKLIQDTMISTLNFSQQEIDNVSSYSKELIKEIIKEIICTKQQNTGISIKKNKIK